MLASCCLQVSWSRPCRFLLRKSSAIVPTASFFFTLCTTSCTAFSTTTKIMPEPPYMYRSPNAQVLDFSDLSATLVSAEERRGKAYEISREMQVLSIKAQVALESEPDDHGETIQVLRGFLSNEVFTSADSNSIIPPRTPRLANLSNRVEDFCRLLAYRQFLKTGGWLPPTDCFECGATDEEYLAGACMGVCRDLERYAMGRATARDVSSVQAARDLVSEILEYLMQFDFRNGPLRRKYDGTKYALKTLETLLYELSVTGATLKGEDEIFNCPQAKKAKIIDSTCKPQEALDAIRSRMEHRDELREKLIKKCRDSQKLAKQAIYALHRGDYKKSTSLIQQCEQSIQNELLPIVAEEPPLRSGSFASVLEEYAEAKLFHVWLLGKEEGDDSTKGALLLPSDFAIKLEPEEYLGGLCDLTGEIGRYAVQRGTSRDYDGVRICLEANYAIHYAIQTLLRAPGGIHKKMDQLRKSVEKIERMTYEMSLSKAAGIQKNTEVSEVAETVDGGD